MIDLHLHTTASDGHDSPSQLVDRARAAGLRIIAVTDHDTLAGLEEAAHAAGQCGVELVPGIEITAVWQALDVHVLGYFTTMNPSGLTAFLETQRQDRVARILAMGERLEACGVPIDVTPIIRRAAERPGESVGRPLVAQALVRAGHVTTVRDAFDRWIASGRPAFVPRHGVHPADVIGLIASAGGVASFAHPGLLGHDELLTDLVAAGLDAVEAYHNEHDRAATARYIRLAREHGLAITGGSDYHGGPDTRAPGPGATTLPQEEFERFRHRLKESCPRPS